MIIKTIEIKNFRSFDDRSFSVRFNDGINILVGENNVGKSNILRSFELLKGRDLSPEDYYKGETDREIRITATVRLDSDEMEHFLKRLVPGANSKQTRRLLSQFKRTFQLEYSSKSRTLGLGFQGFWATGDRLYFSRDVSGSYQAIEWENVVQKFLEPQNKLQLVQLIRNELNSKDPRKVVHFRFDISELMLGILSRKVKSFVETRQCPSGSNQSVFESYDGALVADVLANLKNGSAVQRGKWNRIKQEFHNLFPNLELEVTKPAGEPPKIMIVKQTIDYEVPISFVGAGIWEIVILLTHLFSFEGMCFGIDMPELHFHHHTTRLLKGIIKEKSDKNQFFVVTHSPIFIEPDRLENVLLVKECRGITAVRQLDKVPDTGERERLQRHLDENTREFFFSRAVLIVEGQTEKGAMPILAKYLGQDFDKHGISIVEAGSQFSGLFTRILKAFDFPYLVMNDYDALMYICQTSKSNEHSIKTSAVFYDLRQLLRKGDLEIVEKMEHEIQTIGGKQGKQVYSDDCFEKLRDTALKYDVYVLPTDFEGILKRDKYEKFLKEAEKLSGRNKSKVICGRYVAEKMVENKSEIPKEFRDIIDLIVRKSLTS